VIFISFPGLSVFILKLCWLVILWLPRTKPRAISFRQRFIIFFSFMVIHGLIHLGIDRVFIQISLISRNRGFETGGFSLLHKELLFRAGFTSKYCNTLLLSLVYYEASMYLMLYLYTHLIVLPNGRFTGSKSFILSWGGHGLFWQKEGPSSFLTRFHKANVIIT
jgi:hypothetical protein